MSVANLYSWTSFVTDARVELSAKKRGPIKRKRPEGLLKNVGINGGSDTLYFRFHLGGKMLVGYEKEQHLGSDARIAMYCGDVVSVQPEFRGKKGHVMIQVNDSELILKFEDEKQQKEWLAAINYLREHFARAAPGKGLIEEIPLELQVKFISEVEVEKWPEIRKKFDFSKFLLDKGLKPLLTLPVDLLRNRLLISEIVKVTRKRKDYKKGASEPQKDALDALEALEEEGESPGPQGSAYSKKRNILLHGGSPYYMVILSQWPIYKMDAQSFVKDHRQLNEAQTRNCLAFNKIYFFEYQREGDISEARKVCSVL